MNGIGMKHMHARVRGHWLVLSWTVLWRARARDREKCKIRSTARSHLTIAINVYKCSISFVYCLEWAFARTSRIERAPTEETAVRNGWLQNFKLDLPCAVDMDCGWMQSQCCRTQYTHMKASKQLHKDPTVPRMAKNMKYKQNETETQKRQRKKCLIKFSRYEVCADYTQMSSFLLFFFVSRCHRCLDIDNVLRVCRADASFHSPANNVIIVCNFESNLLRKTLMIDTNSARISYKPYAVEVVRWWVLESIDIGTIFFEFSIYWKKWQSAFPVRKCDFPHFLAFDLNFN